MGQKLILIIIFFIFFSSCSKKPNLKNLTFEKAFKPISSIPVPDSLGVSEFLFSVKYINYDTLFFTEMFSRSLFKLTLHNNKIIRIGNIGKGPGEYLSAYDFYYEYKKLYFNDRKDNRLQSIDFDSGLIRQLQVKPVIVHTKLLKVDSEFYFLNWGKGNIFYLYDKYGNGYFKVPRIFREIDSARMPLNLLRNGTNLFFITTYESNIYKLNIHDREESIIKIKNLDNIYNWSSIYDSRKDQKFIENIENRYHTYSSFNLLNLDDSYYFLLSTYPNEKYKAKIILVNNQGNVKLIVNTENYYPLATIKNKILMYRTDNYGALHFCEFHLKKEILNYICREQFNVKN